MDAKESALQGSQKKAYTTPQLTLYGSVEDLTKGATRGGTEAGVFSA